MIDVELLRKDMLPASFQPPRSDSDAGAVWAQLAVQVTKLEVDLTFEPYNDPSTGIVAGLGALTALRSQYVYGYDTKAGWQVGDDELPREPIPPLDFTRLHAPHLTYLRFNCANTLPNMDTLPRLVDAHVTFYDASPGPLIRWQLPRKRRGQRDLSGDKPLSRGARYSEEDQVE